MSDKSNGSPPDLSDKQALAWLADVLRTQGIVSPPPGGKMEALVKVLKEKWSEQLRVGDASPPNEGLRWLDSIGLLDEEVDYEPRCLAVSHNGARVAVGTKSATLYCAHFEQREKGGGHWNMRQLGAEPNPRPKTLEDSRSKNHPRRRAIRLLGFIDDEHIIVGGGVFRQRTDENKSSKWQVWNVNGEGDARTIAEFAPTKGDDQGLESGPELATRDDFNKQFHGKYPDTWFTRMETWIPLLPPGRNIAAEPFGGELPVGLAVTSGEDLCLITASKATSTGSLEFKWQQLAPEKLFYVDSVGRCGFSISITAARQETEDPDKILGLRSNFGRIVGGVFWRWAIWLLTDTGFLYRYDPNSYAGWTRGARLPLQRVFDGPLLTAADGAVSGIDYTKPHWVRRIPLPPGVLRFARLRASWDGLGVQAGPYVTVLGSNLPTGKGCTFTREERAAHQPLFANPIWQHLPNVTDFTLFRAFINGADDQPPNSFKPLWLLANSEKQQGLLWLMWTSRPLPGSRDEYWNWQENADKPHPGLLPMSRGPIPSSSAAALDEVLALAHGAQRSPDGEPVGTTPCFLVMGTRNHHLRIASLIHTRATESLLLERIEDWGKCPGTPGIRRLRARRAIFEECGLGPMYLIGQPHRQAPFGQCSEQAQLEASALEPTPLEGELLSSAQALRSAWRKAIEMPGWLSGLTASDLRDLAQLLVGVVLRRTRRRLGTDSEGDGTQTGEPAVGAWEPLVPTDRLREAARFIDRFQSLVLTLLRRTIEIEDDPQRHLRHELATLFIHGIEQYATGCLTELRLMGEMLRKWVKLGSTYDTKPNNHTALAQYNIEGRRDLDALAYIVRLIQRRVDVICRSQPPESETPAAWSLAVDNARGDGLVIQAHHDGRLTAINRKGRRVRWVSSESWGDPDELCGGSLPLGAPRELQGSEPSDWVEPWYTQEYKRQYWNGPYVRALWLRALNDENTKYGLFFVSKGHRMERSVGATVFAAILDYDAKALKLTVVEGVCRRSPTEVYSFLDSTSRKSGPMAAGLRGTPLSFELQPDDDKIRWSFARCNPIFEQKTAADGRSNWVIRIRDAAHKVFDAPGPSWQRQVLRIGQKPAESLGTYNPSGAMAHFIESSSKAELLLVGLDDGTIEAFARDPKVEDWTHVENLILPRRTSKITALAVEEIFAAGDNRFVVVALGTAAGEIAVWVWRLEKHEPFSVTKAGRHAPLQLIHTQERADIVMLHFYDDESPCPQERSRFVPYDPKAYEAKRLMAVTKGGIVAIFDLDIGRARTHDGMPFAPIEDTHADIKPTMECILGYRWPSGERLDHFTLGTDVRCCAVMVLSDRMPLAQQQALISVAGSPPLQFVVATPRGEVIWYSLVAPKQTGRRHRLLRTAKTIFDGARTLYGEPDVDDRCMSNVYGVAAAVGPTRVWAWLQMQDTNTLAITRYSLWMMVRFSADGVRRLLDNKEQVMMDMARAGETNLETLYQERLEEEFKGHADFVDFLGRTIHDLRPLSKQPVKVLWQDAAQLANHIARRALVESDPAYSDTLLKYYQRLNESLEAMSSRWTGAPPLIETAVRMHSFAVLFDWADVLILAHPHPSTVTLDVQQHLLRHIVQERLYHDELLVALEAMHVINLAITRALDQLCRRHSPLKATFDTPRLGAGGVLPPNGFVDLLVMVGGLVERRQVKLDSTSPLYTEVSRFFARALFLFPHSALAIAMFATEYGLMERQELVVAGVTAQAQHLLYELTTEFQSVEVDHIVLNNAIVRFRNYLAGTKLELESKPWDKYSDHDISYEFDIVKSVSRRFESLDANATTRTDGDMSAGRVSVVRPDGEAIRYFAHSEGLLKKLANNHAEVSTELREFVNFGGDHATQQHQLDQSIETAKKVIRTADIFAPQQKYYLEIIDKWAFEVRARGAGFAELLALLDRYNRHVHRASADHFLTIFTELILQEHPIQLSSSTTDGSFAALIKRHLESHPVWAEAYFRARRMVGHANLQSALLWAATTAVGLITEGTPLAHGSVSLPELVEKFEYAAIEQRIGFGAEASINHYIRESETPPSLPGYSEVWDLICAEIATDIDAYASPPDGGRATLHVDYFPAKETGCRPVVAVRSSQAFSPLKAGESEQDNLDQDEIQVLLDALRSVRSRGNDKGVGIDMMTTLCRLSGIEFDIALLPAVRPRETIARMVGNAFGWRTDPLHEKEARLRRVLNQADMKHELYFTYIIMPSSLTKASGDEQLG